MREMRGDMGADDAPRAESPLNGSFSLARPWTFPSGHPDSFLNRWHARTPVQIPVEITLYRPDGSSYDKGSGVIQDMSYSGLRLGDVILAHGRLLARCFTIDLRPALEPPSGHDIAGRVLRAFSRGLPGFGVEFLFPELGAERRLWKMS